MQSFIISSKNQGIIDQYLEKIYHDLKIDHFDKTVIDDNKKIIGIEEIRNIQKRIYLKPVRGKTKAVVIRNAETSTTEAQNAFLKVLEEPPESTVIILATHNHDLLLPTIISRCKIITLEKNELILEKNELDKSLTILGSFLSATLGTKLKLAQDFGKNRETALDFLTKMIIAARQKLLDCVFNKKTEDSLISQYLNILVALNKSYLITKTTNVNPRVILENFFLSIC